MAIKNVFKSTIPQNTFLFKNGKAAVFIHGRYETDDADEITQLNAEIRGGIPYIYIDPQDASIDSSLQDEIRQAQIQAMEAVYKKRREAESGTIVDVSGTPLSSQVVNKDIGALAADGSVNSEGTGNSNSPLVPVVGPDIAKTEPEQPAASSNMARLLAARQNTASSTSGS